MMKAIIQIQFRYFQISIYLFQNGTLDAPNNPHLPKCKNNKQNLKLNAILYRTHIAQPLSQLKECDVSCLKLLSNIVYS